MICEWKETERKSSQIHKQDILEFLNLETEAERKNTMFISTVYWQNHKKTEPKAVAAFHTPWITPLKVN